MRSTSENSLGSDEGSAATAITKLEQRGESQLTGFNRFAADDSLLNGRRECSASYGQVSNESGSGRDAHDCEEIMSGGSADEKIDGASMLLLYTEARHADEAYIKAINRFQKLG